MKKVLIPVLFLFFTHILHAQNSNDWTTITFMNDISDMVFHEGHIWTGTSGGAYRFNPADSSCITYSKTDGLASLNLTSITSDKYNHIIAASFDGIINLFDENSDEWVDYRDMLGEEIVDLYALSDTLWVATQNGVGVFLNGIDGLEFRDFYNNLPIIPEKANRITIFQNHIFYATENGLIYASSDFIGENLKIASAWQVLTTSDGLPSNQINDIAVMGDVLYVATEGGAAWIDDSFIINPVEGWTMGAVDLIIKNAQQLYFIKSQSYYRFQNNIWELQNTLERDITSGLLDNENNLWLGLNNSGLFRQNWSQPFRVEGPGSNHVGVLIKAKDGSLWMASGKFNAFTREGFYQLDSQSWKNYKFFDNLWSRKNDTDFVFEDRFGTIWIGSWGGGITTIDESGISFYHAWPNSGRLIISTASGEEEIYLEELPALTRECLAGANVGGSDTYTVITHFIEGPEGNLWCANYLALGSQYLVVIPGNEQEYLVDDCSQWTYLGQDLTQEEGQISSMEFDDFGRLWMGTLDRGILVLDYNGTIENPNDDTISKATMTSDNLFSNEILSIKKDLDGVLWIGTAGGLNSYQNDPSGVNQIFFKHVGDVGPIENKINQIYIDVYNNKWFATDGGLSILEADKSPWDPAAWIHYTVDNSGLPSPIVNSVYVDTETGAAYLGTEGGLAIFKGPFSEFKQDLAHLTGGPNPFILNDNSIFTIKNLVTNANVKILNINGRVVKTLTEENGFVSGSRAVWDGMDSENNRVPSGIYLYLAFNDQGITGSGKIAVIKP